MLSLAPVEETCQRIFLSRRPGIAIVYWLCAWKEQRENNEAHILHWYLVCTSIAPSAFLLLVLQQKKILRHISARNGKFQARGTTFSNFSDEFRFGGGHRTSCRDASHTHRSQCTNELISGLLNCCVSTTNIGAVH